MFFEDRFDESFDHDALDGGPDTEQPHEDYQKTAGHVGRNTQVGAASVIQRLLEATENERHCPDVLPYPGEIIEEVMRQLTQKQAHIKELADEEKQQAAEETNAVSLLPLKPSDIMALELQRVRFFLSELLRCRLRKIEDLCMSIYYEGLLESGEHAVGDFTAVGQPQRSHLSHNERIVADRLATCAHQAVLHCGLQGVPPALQQLVPSLPRGEGAEILPEPDDDVYVFGIALEDLGVVQLGEGAEQVVNAGEIFLIPYRTFRPYVITGQVRLV